MKLLTKSFPLPHKSWIFNYFEKSKIIVRWNKKSSQIIDYKWFENQYFSIINILIVVHTVIVSLNRYLYIALF